MIRISYYSGSGSGSGSRATSLMTKSWNIYSWLKISNNRILIIKKCCIFLRLASKKDLTKLPRKNFHLSVLSLESWKLPSKLENIKIMKQVTNNLFFDTKISTRTWYGKELPRYCWEFSNGICFGVHFCMKRRSFNCSFAVSWFRIFRNNRTGFISISGSDHFDNWMSV